MTTATLDRTDAAPVFAPIDPSTVPVGGKLAYPHFVTDPQASIAGAEGHIATLRDGYLGQDLGELLDRVRADLGRPGPMAEVIAAAGIHPGEISFEIVRGSHEEIRDLREGLIGLPEYWVAKIEDTVGYGERDSYVTTDLVFTRLA